MLDAAAVAAISDVIFQFDASDIDGDGDTSDQPSNGTSITTWTDSKGAADNATSSGSASPTYQDNIFETGLGGIVFDGVDDEFGLATTNEINNINHAEKSFALTFRTSADIISNQIIYEQGGTSNAISFSIFGGDIYAYQYIGGTTNALNLGAAQANTTYNLIAVYDNITTNTWSARLNGAATSTAISSDMLAHSGLPGIGGENDTTKSPLDHSDVSNAYFEGTIGEIWSWNHALTAGEITSVENYLEAKWINTEPSIDENNTLFISDGANTTITNSILSSSDIQQNSTEIIYTLTSIPANGNIQLNAADLGINDTFTQDDIDNSRVRFVHDGSGLGTNTFGFTVSDGIDTVTGQTFNISIVDFNNPNVTTNTGVNVETGVTTTLTTSMLNVTDSDTAASNVDFNITAGLNAGQLELTTNPGIAVTTFTLQDLQSNLVVYVHDGSQSDDSFTFNTSDGVTTLTGHVFNIDANQSPVILANSTVVTDEDFEGGAVGWNNNTTSSSANFSEFLGRFAQIGAQGDQDIFKTYALSGTQNHILIEFDFYEIDDWDTENFLVYIDDTEVISQNYHRETYDQEADGSSGNVSWTVQELTESAGDIGFTSNRHDQIIRYQLRIETNAASIKLGFGTSLSSTSLSDESWGIDNLIIREYQGSGGPSYNASELVQNGDFIGQVQSSDNENGTISYTRIAGGTGDGIFDIDYDGNITVIDETAIDYESGTTSYTLNIRATDDGLGSPSSDQTVTINILNANETPVWTTPSSPFATISEDSANGTIVGNVSGLVSDPEGDTITYVIETGNNENIFAINSSTGEITLADNSLMDFEYDNSYTLRISARSLDTDATSMQTDQNIVINISDSDEAPSVDPIQTIINLDPSVRYNATTGSFYKFVQTNVTYATALSDAATATLNGVNGHLVTITSATENSFVDSIILDNSWIAASDSAQEGTWIWTVGDESGEQFWDGGSTGVTVGGYYSNWRSGEPNGDDNAIIRTDGSWQDTTGSQSYVIEWSAEDVINNDSYSITHTNPDASDLSINDSFGFVMGIDPEGDSLTYSITGGNASNIFDINPTTGEVFLADKTNLDATVQNIYTLTIRATEDNGSNQFDERAITFEFNALPQGVVNNPTTLDEGATVTLTTANLDLGDTDDPDTDIIFTIDSAPSNGQLELTSSSGDAITSFTLDDIKNNRVIYAHFGGENTNDSFDFIISDNVTSLPTETFNITITPVNDAPIVTNIGQVAGQGNDADSSAIDAISDEYLHFDALDLDGDGSSSDQPAEVDADNPESELGAVFTTGSGTDAFNSTTTEFPNTANSFFAIDVVIPADPSGSLFEAGGGGTGIYVGFDSSDNFVLRAGDGASPPGGVDTDLTTAAILRTSESAIAGLSGTIFAELNVTDGSVSAWFLEGGVNGGGTPVLLGTATAPSGGFEGGRIHGGGSGGLGGTNSGVGGEDNSLTNVTITDFRFYTNALSPIGTGGNPSLPSNTWVDQAGVGTEINNATNAATYNPDAFGTDLGGVDFSGTNTGLSIAQSTEYNDSPNDSRSFAISFKTGSDVSGNQVIFEQGGSTNGYNFSIINGNLYAYTFIDSGTTGSSIDLGPVYADSVYTITAIQDVAGNWSAGINTDTHTSGGIVAETTHGDEGGLGNVINDTRNPEDLTSLLTDTPFEGSIGEVRAWNKALNASELNDVKTYFTAKWGRGSSIPDNFDVAESANIGDLVIDADVLNPEDFKGETVSWSIQSGNDGTFAIDASTGEITIADTTNINFEDGSNLYTLVIRATDTGVDSPGSLSTDVTMTVTITDVNESPVIDTNTGATLSEGASLTITNTLLAGSDVDASDTSSDITYTTSAILNGHIEVSGGMNTVFTQADIDAGNVVYVHDGSEPSATSFNISLADGGEDGATAATGTFSITILPVNDAPTISANSMDVGIGADKLLTSTDIGITDPDNTDAELIINITTAPTRGQIELVSAPGVAINNFTYQQVLDGDIRYDHAGGIGNDSLVFSLTDGTDTLINQNFTINIIGNNNPVITDIDLHISETANIGDTVGTVVGSDLDEPLANLNFSILSGNSDNIFTISASGVITIADDTNLSYENTTSYDLVVELEDSLGGKDTETITIDILNRNETPLMNTNLGHTLDEGSTSTIENTALSATDTDTISTTDWYDTNWQYRNKITIDAANINADLTDFAIYLSETNFGETFWNNVQNDGGDIVITAADGTTKLNRELVSIDTGAETMELHAKIPTISSTIDTEFYIYFGNATANETNDSSVWNNNFEGVWHLDEADANSQDSTSNSNNGTAIAGANGVSGQISDGIDFDGNADGVNLGDIDEVELGAVTFSFWAQIDSNSQDHDFITKGIHNQNQPILIWYDDSVNGAIPSIGAGNTDTLSVLWYDGAVQNWIAAPTDALNNLDWNHIAVTIDPATTTTNIYINGSLLASDNATTSSGIQADTDEIRIGTDADGGAQDADARMDELKIASTALSADWIFAEYTNQATPSSFYSVGGAETQIEADNQTYEITTNVSNGSLFLDANSNGTAQIGEILALNDTFTQDDIDNGLLKYVHNGSDTLSDSFDFTLSDGFITTGANTFNIIVTPVDDIPVLLTNNILSINENDSVLITTADLNASDVDTLNTNIVFNITTIDGTIELNTAPGTTISNFTLDDLQNNRVIYIHDGSENTLAGFDFAIADATTSLSSSNFAINIAPVNDAPEGLSIDNDQASEDLSTGLTIGTLAGIDVDIPSDTLSYEIVDQGIGNIFRIDDNLLVLNQSLDFESATLHNLTIRVSDGAEFFESDITINVLDVNENTAGLNLTQREIVNGYDNFASELVKSSQSAPSNALQFDGIGNIIGSVIDDDIIGLTNSIYKGNFLDQIIREQIVFKLHDQVGTNSQDDLSPFAPLALSDIIPSQQIANNSDANNIEEESKTEQLQNTRDNNDFYRELLQTEGAQGNQALKNSLLGQTELSPIEQQFEDVLTYHEKKQAKLRQALLS